MNVNIFNAVAALLSADESLRQEDRIKILEVCKHPSAFNRTEEKALPRFLTVSQVQAAKCLNVSRQTIWRMTKAGRIRQIMLLPDGAPRYSMADLEKLIVCDDQPRDMTGQG